MFFSFPQLHDDKEKINTSILFSILKKPAISLSICILGLSKKYLTFYKVCLFAVYYHHICEEKVEYP